MEAWYASSAWHHVNRSEWPEAHESDSKLSHIRLYVYDFSRTNFSLTAVLQFAVSLSSKFYGSQDDCLIRYCEFGVSTPTLRAKGGHVGQPWVNARALTSEIPVLLRLLSVCTLVSDPLQADAFLVPVTLGTLATISWAGKSRFFRGGSSITPRLQQTHSHTHVMLWSL